MIRLLFTLILTGPLGLRAEDSGHGRPAVIATSDLVEFEKLPSDRQKLIAGAIAVARDSPWLRYRFGGSDPKDGGFDCSGAMFFVMRQAGLKPPRTSAEQFRWLVDSGRLTAISPVVKSLRDPQLQNLLPGDVLFWSGTATATPEKNLRITHVALFLGHEKTDRLAVMINATDGRSYRGIKANGHGVYDFQVPRAGSRAVLVGYGTPPGIALAK